MAVRSNGFYNNPEIGQAFASVAQAFAPPDGTQVLAYTKAAAEKAKEARLAELYAYAKDPTFNQTQFDRQNIAAGNYNPTSSYYAVDRSNATSLANNAADNERAVTVAGMNNRNALTTAMLSPVGAGATRFVPPKLAEMFGTDAQQTGVVDVGTGHTATLPGGTVIEGRQTAPTMDSVKAAVFQGMPIEQQQAATFGNTPLQTIMGDDGKSKLVTSLDAIGQQPVEKDAGKAQLNNYKTPDGKTGSARFDPTSNKWMDTQTGAELPAGTVTYGATLQGDKDATGLGTGVKNNVESQLMDLSLAKSTSDQLRSIVSKNPAVNGFVGQLRGTAQNVFATGGEVANLLGANQEQLKNDILKGRVDPEVLAKFRNFDPNIPAVELLETMLTAQVAKVLDPNGRISNDRYNQVSKALGSGGWLSNTQRTMATLDTLDKIIAGRRNLLEPVAPGAATAFNRPGQIDPRPAAAAAQQPNPVASGAPRAAPADLPIMPSPEAALVLPPGTRFRTPDGREKVRP